ncbi:MAG: PTS sugar transporter subunit IIA [Verrucomicrobia bacterium]|nr:PTS sugar transporter subunit IIA [Verrucomicrobiota bacterium]
MNRIREILLPEHILLDLKATSREEAVAAVADSLHGDPRIIDWPRFLNSLNECEHSGKINLALGLTLSHNRTRCVNSMVMAFGRMAEPIPCDPSAIRFIVIIGIPETMDADYLRLVGGLMRVFRDHELRQRLEKGEAPRDILDAFEQGEKKLGS